MRWNSRCPHGLLGFLLATLGIVLLPSPTHAQWGFGYGWGGFGGFNYVPQPTNYLNQWSLQQAARAGPPAQNRPYAGSSNAYFNNIRDSGFGPQYEVQRRRRPVQQQRTPTSPGERTVAQTAPPAARPAPKPIIPLASFFDAARKLVWPAEAPVAGDLQQKRDISDEASRAVLDETKVHVYASLSTVADARQKLLDYGRPALKEIRQQATPRVADTFHLFLLSLYESLAQAATPPEG